MEQVSISSWDGQMSRDHHSTSYLLDRLDFPPPTRCTGVEVPNAFIEVLRKGKKIVRALN
jgi:hypothetical protein